MKRTEYRIAECLGADNVRKAIEDKTAEDNPWLVNSICPAGVQVIPPSGLNPQAPPMMIPMFIVLFEREFEDSAELPSLPVISTFDDAQLKEET